MAETKTDTASRTRLAPGEPVLRPGRAADPVPVPTGSLSQAVSEPAPAYRSANPAPETAPKNAEEGDSQPSAATEQGSGSDAGAPEDQATIDQALAEAQQRKLRLMLKQCDRVLLLDFDLLAMPNWPDNYSLAVARRSRDVWLFCALVAAMVFLSGLTGFIPAWVAGGGFGAFVIILMLGVPTVRRIYTARPSYLDLVVKRQRMLRDARKHIDHLEGEEGLVWQCARMTDFNASLRSSRFSELLALSEHRALARNMTRREYIRLYLIYLLEAEKAYDRVQQAFFDGNQQALCSAPHKLGRWDS
ncbi:hypothetical protein [Marinobacter sp.]|uniref:hypothetical protein n=1 Tax=Marinobacter sp. TaxID=50741 RepID=UPI0034A3ED1B